ncbi:MAG: hypothetical protein CL785_02975 [Chloroflexi bacterium]|nr:hypothetical protein [Chloroflexota bacterium]|tara:strand:+ start:6620 stop:7459 length:840 start_codon:yes stop_codon:yes gene_type:complete
MINTIPSFLYKIIKGHTLLPLLKGIREIRFRWIWYRRYREYKICIKSNRPYFGAYLDANQTAHDMKHHITEFMKTELADITGSYSILEIGCWAGESTIMWSDILKKFPDIDWSITCVDPWFPYPGVNAVMSSALNKSKIFDLFIHNINCAGIADRVHIYRGTSDLLLPSLKDSQFDLVFIDGDHRYDQVIKDLERSNPLVKNRGILCGDDLDLQYHEINQSEAMAFKNTDVIIDLTLNKPYHPGVTVAINEFFGGPIPSMGAKFYAMRKHFNAWEPIAQ